MFEDWFLIFDFVSFNKFGAGGSYSWAFLILILQKHLLVLVTNSLEQEQEQFVRILKNKMFPVSILTFSQLATLYFDVRI